MMKLPIILFFCFTLTHVFAQEETFDQVTYTAPKAWKKEVSASAIQFAVEDETKGTFCMITILKAVPATNNSKDNFDMAWNSVVKGMVNVNDAPQMQEPATENGWTAQSGYATFEKDEVKGGVVLVTSTGIETMINMVILTNTQAYEKEITDFLTSISLKKPDNLMQPKNVMIKPPSSEPATAFNGYAITTTNFDDGWNSTPKEDWVEVSKGDIKVLIHYPNKPVDGYSSDLMTGLKNAWDVLLAPRYSNARNMDFKPLFNFESIEYAKADMVENASGNTVHVVFFKKLFNRGTGRYIEFISPSKEAFEKEFGAYNSSALAEVWNKMANMVTYNKFAVSTADLNGAWTSDFSGMTQYVNAFTGADAGASTHASNQSFVFGANSTYNWDLDVASGFVGNIKFQIVKSSGTFSMLNNWQLNFSDIEGKPKTVNLSFTCIKGARVLWIGDTSFGKIN